MSNQNNQEITPKQGTSWKTYLSLVLYALLGLALGYAVAKGVLYFINKPETPKEEIVENNKNSETEGTSHFTGEVSAWFEGDNVAALHGDFPEDFTITQGGEDKPRNFDVKDANGNTVAYIYISYEGGRGYTPEDYFSNNIAPSFADLSAPAEVTYGDLTWTRAETANTEWHLRTDGEWIIYVENAKANHDRLASVYETLDLE